MSDSLRLYRTIIEMIQNSRGRFHDMRCLITFTWAIVGVILERSVHLSKWSVLRVGEAQAASKQRQFVRWLKNARWRFYKIWQSITQIQKIILAFILC
jgi:hypothetical protein